MQVGDLVTKHDGLVSYDKLHIIIEIFKQADRTHGWGKPVPRTIARVQGVNTGFQSVVDTKWLRRVLCR